MERPMLEFLFAGPLFSIFKSLNRIERNQMTLKQDLQQLNSDLNSGLDAVGADLSRLEDKIANSPVAEDVSEELTALRGTVDRLRSLDLPDPDQPTGIDTGTAGGGSILTPTEPEPDHTTVRSPGEPITELPESEENSDESAPEEAAAEEDSSGEPTDS